MSDIAHRLVRDADTWEYGCVCGSAWNHLADTCSSIIPIPVPEPFEREDDYFDLGYFECRRGHAFCERH